MRLFLNLLLSEDGATTVEYAVMLALLISVMLISISALGNGVQSMWLVIIGELDSRWS
jgi:Flp pilus assembly pilin Flp